MTEWLRLIYLNRYVLKWALRPYWFEIILRPETFTRDHFKLTTCLRHVTVYKTFNQFDM